MQRPSFSIYDASAGSGKTYALVKEYLKIILGSKKPDAYRNILAITFTNKAVHEMKSRIVGGLSEFTKDNPNQKALDLMHDLSDDLKLSLIEIKTKSQQIIKHIIHNYAAFDISTIDKFTHKVIRAFAHDLGLPMTFEVTLDTENLLTEAVDALIAEAGNDIVLTKLLIDFTMEKTDDDKSWDISREILETGRLILNENNRFEVSHFEHKKIEDFIEIKTKLLKEVQNLGIDNKSLAINIFSILESNNIDLKSFSHGTFPNHIQFIIDNDIRVNNYKFLRTEEVKVNNSAKDSNQIETVLPEILNLLSKVYINNEKKDFYQAFLKNITPLSLLNTINDKLKNIQQQQNILSISEFNALIYNEIQNQPAPFIYERLGEKYRHFFIDEFQDTSEMQWQNLIPLIDNATSSEINGEKGTLMIVGDPKQSIYRWRGGKAEQFIELSKNKNPFNNPEKVITPLYQNYRSYSQVIEFNNELFQMLASEFDNLDYNNLYKNHVVQRINKKVGGYVNITFLPKIEDLGESIHENEEPIEKSDFYVLKTLNTINKCRKQGFEYKDIVILTRKRTQGIAIANYLTKEKIPILSSETLMIANATEVRLIIFLLKYLQNSNDLDSKANFLQYLAENAQTEMPIHDFIAKGIELEIESEFENWLEKCHVKLSFSNIRKKSLYEAVEIIISKFLSITKLKVDQATPLLKGGAYVQYFLDIVLERDIRNQAGIADFLNYWDKNSDKFSIPSPDGTNAVKIMTIHKSKGLEFPVVIFPFAEEDYNHKPKSKLWLNADQEIFGLPKVLIDNSKIIEGFGEEASEVYNQKKQEELLDNINVLYVALTRAEEQLFIISNMNLDKDKNPRKNNMSSFFINYLKKINLFDVNQLEYEFGTKTKLSELIKHIDNTKNIEVVEDLLNFTNIKIAQRESLMWGTQRQESIEYGNVVHEILSFIKTKTDINLAITKALETGLIKSSQKKAVEKSIYEIVNHKDLENCFSGDIQVLNEQIIIQKAGQTIKPDRIVINKNNEVHILDYKTGMHQSKYKLQLENYQTSIEKMGYKVTKKSLIYIGEEINIINL
ncbi:MAG: UvrD-helicase domain-containing protein [Flavobacterium sp.]|nr:UvrD-helicase domain-containing protein [Flavobacterium sp.]